MARLLLLMMLQPLHQVLPEERWLVVLLGSLVHLDAVGSPVASADAGATDDAGLPLRLVLGPESRSDRRSRRSCCSTFPVPKMDHSCGSRCWDSSSLVNHDHRCMRRQKVRKQTLLSYPVLEESNNVPLPTKGHSCDSMCRCSSCPVSHGHRRMPGLFVSLDGDKRWISIGEARWMSRDQEPGSPLASTKHTLTVTLACVRLVQRQRGKREEDQWSEVGRHGWPEQQLGLLMDSLKRMEKNAETDGEKRVMMASNEHRASLLQHLSIKLPLLLPSSEGKNVCHWNRGCAATAAAAAACTGSATSKCDQ